MPHSPDEGLLAPSDVAELADVSRATVSGWRKRDFPNAVAGTSAKPLFSRSAVMRWLIDNGYTAQLKKAPAELAVLATVNSYRDELPSDLTRNLVLTVLCARKLAENTDLIKALTADAELGQLLDQLRNVVNDPAHGPQWLSIVKPGLDALDFQLAGRNSPPRGRQDLHAASEKLAAQLFLSVTGGSAAAVADLVLQRLASGDGRSIGVHGAVRSRLSKLLAQAVADSEGTIYDPACGIGEALLRTWEANPDKERRKLIGSDKDQSYVLICRQRCFLHGAPATVVETDVLKEDLDPALRAEIIIIEPPFAQEMPDGFNVTDPRWAIAGLPPKNNSETAWLQHAVYHLSPNGRGYVITSANTSASSAVADIRSALVRQGCVEAVVALPRKFLTHSAVPTALWVLRSTGSILPLQEVSFVDASEISLATFDDDDNLEHLVAQFLRPGGKNRPNLRSRHVPIEDIVSDGRVNLDPRHWTRSSGAPEDAGERYREAVSELKRLIGTLAFHPANEEILGQQQSRPATLRALERQGAIRVLRSRAGNRLGEDGRPLSTRVGDLLVTKKPRIKATVDETGGHVLDPGEIALRVDTAHFHPRYVAECLAASWNQRGDGQTPQLAGNIRELEIPLIPLDDQRRIVREVDEARRLAEAGQRMTRLAEEIASARLDAVRFGVSGR